MPPKFRFGKILRNGEFSLSPGSCLVVMQRKLSKSCNKPIKKQIDKESKSSKKKVQECSCYPVPPLDAFNAPACTALLCLKGLRLTIRVGVRHYLQTTARVRARIASNVNTSTAS